VRPLPTGLAVYLHMTTDANDDSIKRYGLVAGQRDGMGTPTRGSRSTEGIFAWAPNTALGIHDALGVPKFILSRANPGPDRNIPEASVMFNPNRIRSINRFGREKTPDSELEAAHLPTEASLPPSTNSFSYDMDTIAQFGPAGQDGAAAFLNQMKPAQARPYTPTEARLTIVQATKDTWPMHMKRTAAATPGGAGPRPSGAGAGKKDSQRSSSGKLPSSDSGVFGKMSV